MNVKSVEKENNHAKITVEFERSLLESGIDKAYRKICKSISIPGFRKGKAPRKMVEKMYGAEVFYEDGVEEIFPEIYKETVLDQGVKAVGQPSISDMNVTADTVTIVIETALYPEVKLGQYKGLEISKAEAAVSEEEIEAELDRKAKDIAAIETVERPAELGDTVVLDFEGFVDGKAFDGGKAEKYELTLGSGAFIPGFEEQVVGLSAGEGKDVVVTFPENYQKKSLAGKEATFKVHAHEVKKTIVPEKDDEFVKDVSEFNTLDELKQDIRAKILDEKQAGIDSAFENAAIEKAAGNMEADIPECMIDDEVQKEMERFDYDLRAQGASLEMYAKMMGGNLDAFRASIRPAATTRLRANIMLDAVVDAEGLDASDEEAEEEYAKLAESYKMELSKVKELVKTEDVKDELKIRKARKLIVDSAVAVAPAAAEEAPKAKKTRAKKASEDGEAGAEEAPKAKRTRAKKADAEKTEE